MGFNVTGTVVSRNYQGKVGKLANAWNCQLNFIGEISFRGEVENCKEDFDQQVLKKQLVSTKRSKAECRDWEVLFLSILTFFDGLTNLLACTLLKAV